MHFSKMDQLGKGRSFELEVCSDQELCPVRVLEQYWGVRGWEAWLLFRHVDGTPLSCYQFWAVMTKALEALGIRFGTHSFRIVMASTAAALGYPVPSIQGIGHWSSHTYQRYVCPVVV